MKNLLQLEADMEVLGENYATWKAQASHLERMRKVLLAQLMLEHMGKPVNERDMRARASEGYMNHILGQKEAETKFHKYQAEWITIQEKIANRRTMAATERAKINLV